MIVKADVTSIAGLAVFVAGMENRTEDLSIPLSDFADILLLDVMDSFPTGGATLGESWPAHSEATIARWGAHPFGEGPPSNNPLLPSIHKFVRKFLCGVEATAPHAHLFENGKLATRRKAKKAVHSAARYAASMGDTGAEEVWGSGLQPGRDFLEITPNREQLGIAMVLDYVLPD